MRSCRQARAFTNPKAIWTRIFNEYFSQLKPDCPEGINWSVVDPMYSAGMTPEDAAKQYAQNYVPPEPIVVTSQTFTTRPRPYSAYRRRRY
jgi:hypothetical protein